MRHPQEFYQNSKTVSKYFCKKIKRWRITTEKLWKICCEIRRENRNTKNLLGEKKQICFCRHFFFQMFDSIIKDEWFTLLHVGEFGSSRAYPWTRTNTSTTSAYPIKIILVYALCCLRATFTIFVFSFSFKSNTKLLLILLFFFYKKPIPEY